MQRLYAPWRYALITGQAEESGCFLCRSAGAPEARESLVVHRGRSHLVVLNRYPYNNGHLMVAPPAHVAEPEALSPRDRAELWEALWLSRRVLDTVYRPDGFNVGLNLGEVAGAGLVDHLHLHLVPRWSGDANFMTVTAEARVLPEDLPTAWNRLREAFAKEAGGD